MPGRPHTPRRALGAGLLASIVALALAACGGSSDKHAQLPPTMQRSGPETMFTAGNALLQNPVGTVAELRKLGVDRVRVFVEWGALAPHSHSRHKPSFDETDPAAYEAGAWAVYDTIIRQVLAQHMAVDVVLGPPPPVWADAPGAPNPTQQPWWKPSATDFQKFVEAVGKRYSGHYRPAGQSSPLPRVGFWSVWNEPNNGVQLSPQTTHSGSSVEVAPRLYRALADAAWTGLHRTGHGHDTILLGEVAPVGSTGNGRPGLFAVMTPLRFLRALYCVDTDDKPLTGAAATERGCPADHAGSEGFAAANPILFKATAFADHPYSFGAFSPVTPVPHSPDDTDLPQIGNLFRALDRFQEAYGSDKRFKVWSTEYGYQTSPPGTQSGLLPPAKAAAWINWAEYLSWRQPRLVSYDQYLVQDPPPIPGQDYKAFASGIATYAGKRKPGYAAFRMPVWLPVTRTAKGDPLEVWGCVRPAKTLPTAQRPPAEIQWRASGASAWKTVARVPVRSAYGYFDVKQRFAGSGEVRLSWTPPHGSAIHSRTTPITIR